MKGAKLQGCAVGKKLYLGDKERLSNSKVLFRARCLVPCVDLPSSEGRENTAITSDGGDEKVVDDETQERGRRDTGEKATRHRRDDDETRER